MNKKQKLFCDEYLIDCNATQAAIRAGYSLTTANRIGYHLLNQNTETKEYIERQLNVLHNARTADAQEALEYITSVMRGEETDQALCETDTGTQEVIEMRAKVKDRLKAAELIGKRHGVFVCDKNETKGEPIIIINDITR